MRKKMYKKAGKKMLAVTKEDLDSWKKKNKGNHPRLEQTQQQQQVLMQQADAYGQHLQGKTLSSEHLVK